MAEITKTRVFWKAFCCDPADCDADQALLAFIQARIDCKPNAELIQLTQQIKQAHMNRDGDSGYRPDAHTAQEMANTNIQKINRALSALARDGHSR